MNVLGIDGALGSFSGALLGGVQARSVNLTGNVALERGLGAVADLLSGSGIDPSEIDRIGVGIGPGYFTGVRIAISYAKSLALGWQLPLAGISTFDAVEAGLRLEGRSVLNVVRGRPGVLSARWRRGKNVRRASGYTADVLAELHDVLSEPFALIGNGAEDVIAALGERANNVEILTRAIEPAALAVATLAAQREPATSLHEVRADYGELPPARVPKS